FDLGPEGQRAGVAHDEAGAGHRGLSPQAPPVSEHPLVGPSHRRFVHLHPDAGAAQRLDGVVLVGDSAVGPGVEAARPRRGQQVGRGVLPEHVGRHGGYRLVVKTPKPGRRLRSYARMASTRRARSVRTGGGASAATGSVNAKRLRRLASLKSRLPRTRSAGGGRTPTWRTPSRGPGRSQRLRAIRYGKGPGA